MSDKKTKLNVILEAISKQKGLNRFEAEKLGDHCLNSTVSSIRKNGLDVVGKWEQVPNRFGGMTRVKRYWLAEQENGSHERADR